MNSKINLSPSASPVFELLLLLRGALVNFRQIDFAYQEGGPEGRRSRAPACSITRSREPPGEGGSVSKIIICAMFGHTEVKNPPRYAPLR